MDLILATFHYSDVPVCLNYKDQICTMNAWWDRFHMKLEQCYRPQTHYTGSLLTREGIDFYDRKNHTFTRNKSTLLRLWIRRSTNKRIVQKEKLVYDWKDLLSGVGGTLSLLIGISFFSLCNQIIDAMTYGFKILQKYLDCIGKSKKISHTSSEITELGSSANLSKSPRGSKIPRPLAYKTYERP